MVTDVRIWGGGVLIQKILVFIVFFDEPSLPVQWNHSRLEYDHILSFIGILVGCKKWKGEAKGGGLGRGCYRNSVLPAQNEVSVDGSKARRCRDARVFFLPY